MGYNHLGGQVEIVALNVDQAVSEMSHYAEFNYLVINDEFDLALRDLQTIIRSRRQAIGWMQHYKADLIKGLLN